MFSRNDQSPTPNATSTILQLTCHWHPRRPYCRQQAQRPTFCARLTLQRTSLLALPQDPSPSCSILAFRRPAFADHPRAFFSSGDYSTVLLWTTSTRFDLQETFITTFTFSPAVCFCKVPTVLSKYCLLWERIVFFRVVSSFVCINSILEWTIPHSFLFLCSIFSCMYSFDKFTSSLIDSSLQHALDLFRVLWSGQFLEGDTES